MTTSWRIKESSERAELFMQAFNRLRSAHSPPEQVSTIDANRRSDVGELLEVSIFELVWLRRNDDEVWLHSGNSRKVKLGVVRLQLRANICDPHRFEKARSECVCAN